MNIVTILIIFILVSMLNGYYLFRNYRVYEYRTKLLWEKPLPNRHSFLPSYDYMLFHFWVWPLNRFLPKSKRGS